MPPSEPSSNDSAAAYPVRFMILSGPRTGSTLLQSALSSSPEITCFGEIFNHQLDKIDYRTEEYESTIVDMDLRATNPGEFLRKRIFTDPVTPIRATGFKFHYDHIWGFPGLRQALEEDRGLAVIHLRRRNVLRVLVSSKIAEETGVYFQSAGTRSGLQAKIVQTLRGAVRLTRPTQDKVRVKPEEVRQANLESDLTAQHWERIFEGHDLLKLTYEDLVPDPKDEFDRILSFLGVTPADLEVTTARQNPEPLEDLISNYDELRTAFQGTDYESLLD